MSNFWWQVQEHEQQQEAEMCSQTTGENEMSKPSTIIIDEVEYVRADSVSVKPTKKQIVVLQRGWVVIGDVEKTADEVKINNCSVIRVWGTENGLGELAEKGKGGSAGGTIIKLDYRQALKYAAILILVIGPALFLINKINKQDVTTNDIATKETKKQPAPIKIEKAPYNFQLPNADSYNMEKELLQEEKFGFSSSANPKIINIKIYNLNGQLIALENEIEKHKNDLNIKTYLMYKADSIYALKETYIFNKKNGFFIYSVKL